MISVECLVCIADDGFYEQLRNKKNLTREDAAAIRKQTLDEDRRSKVNQISSESKADAERVNEGSYPDPDEDELDEEKEHEPKAAPKKAGQLGHGIPSRNERISNPSPTLKVNPGDLDELEFPGETPAPKKK